MLLHDTFDYSAREHADLPFAIQGARSVTYREAQALANRIANAFVARGIAPGDRVAVLSKNSIEHALLYYACSKSGAVTVPINYRLAPPEWSYILNDSGAKLVFAQDALAEALAPVRSELSAVEHWIGIGKDVVGWGRLRTAPPERSDPRFVASRWPPY